MYTGTAQLLSALQSWDLRLLISAGDSHSILKQGIIPVKIMLAFNTSIWPREFCILQISTPKKDTCGLPMLFQSQLCQHGP